MVFPAWPFSIITQFDTRLLTYFTTCQLLIGLYRSILIDIRARISANTLPTPLHSSRLHWPFFIAFHADSLKCNYFNRSPNKPFNCSRRFYWCILQGAFFKSIFFSTISVFNPFFNNNIDGLIRLTLLSLIMKTIINKN